MSKTKCQKSFKIKISTDPSGLGNGKDLGLTDVLTLAKNMNYFILAFLF